MNTPGRVLSLIWSLPCLVEIIRFPRTTRSHNRQTNHNRKDLPGVMRRDQCHALWTWTESECRLENGQAWFLPQLTLETVSFLTELACMNRTSRTSAQAYDQ